MAGLYGKMVSDKHCLPEQLAHFAFCRAFFTILETNAGSQFWGPNAAVHPAGRSVSGCVLICRLLPLCR